MKRVLIGFWLFVCILLLSGYSELYAHAQAPTVFGTVQNSHVPLIRLNVPGTDKVIHGIEAPAIEEEDDEFNTFKKYLQSRCQFAALFLAQAIKDLLHESAPGGSDFSEHLSYTLSQRSNALLQVFRI